ncbi:hypothetical protein BBC27_00455 [Acidithiobacillus ferrivorans]|uniref:Uncharacterized protein n=1 Tax=Acidithiobacillus ferrivorans TaxID=160808 RepID=A0A1B9C0Z7_9PROT|nr:hypothetical protein [Acidithiobacillus ferrivorans]OCB03611.1 hypothetical protein BBC27_00455 [Acidithiobacillus ferrivorans]
MFALKTLFLDESAAQKAFAAFEETLSEVHEGPAEFYNVLRNILQQGLRLKPAIFSENNVVSCEFFGFDEKESAMAEAALLEAGALEVIVE